MQAAMGLETISEKEKEFGSKGTNWWSALVSPGWPPAFRKSSRVAAPFSTGPRCKVLNWGDARWGSGGTGVDKMPERGSDCGGWGVGVTPPVLASSGKPWGPWAEGAGVLDWAAKLCWGG